MAHLVAPPVTLRPNNRVHRRRQPISLRLSAMTNCGVLPLITQHLAKTNFQRHPRVCWRRRTTKMQAQPPTHPKYRIAKKTTATRRSCKSKMLPNQPHQLIRLFPRETIRRLRLRSRHTRRDPRQSCLTRRRVDRIYPPPSLTMYRRASTHQ